MSWSSNMIRRSGAVGAGLALLAILAGCQVQPLYGSGPSRSVAVSEAGNRVEQVVRNELTFRLGGDRPAGAAYQLDIDADAIRAGLLARGTDTDFTALRVTVTATYILKEAETGSIIKTGSRSADSLIEITTQYYAQDRASIDAENRAAKVAARMIYADVSAVLATRRDQ